MARLKVLAGGEFPVVARMNHLDGQTEEVRHDGQSFYRSICEVGSGRTIFPEWMRAENYLRRTYLKLMDDEHRNTLEFSELTWPAKGTGRNKGRRYVAFSEVSGFELLDQGDVSRCEGEVSQLTEALLVCGERIWIRCGEPCYRLANSRNLHLDTHLTFSDQNERRAVEEMYISATDPERLRAEWRIVADQQDRARGFAAGSIDVLSPSLFVADFDDIGFVKYSDTIARGIAYYLSRHWHGEGEMLMATDPDDIDLWNALRRTVNTMTADDTAASGDDDVVMRAAELWERLGGACYSGSRYFSKETVNEWFGSTVRNWLDRKIDLEAIVTAGRSYSAP
ncbi:hypothetical protein HFN89_01975 [Rhizobium laguerreae]|nr:hypothetical protein [Rhizobium laguerreae]